MREREEGTFAKSKKVKNVERKGIIGMKSTKREKSKDGHRIIEENERGRRDEHSRVLLVEDEEERKEPVDVGGEGGGEGDLEGELIVFEISGTLTNIRRLPFE